MERTLAGMLFLVAAVAFSIAGGAWWMQRVCFTPDDTRDSAAAMLKEPDIRQEINTVISARQAPVLGVNVPELSTFLEDQILSTRAGAAVPPRRCWATSTSWRGASRRRSTMTADR